MRKRWCVYLAALLGCLVLYGWVTGWATWMAVLTVAASPLVSVALSAMLGEEDALGLFRLPSKCGAEQDYDLRKYRLGDAPSRVHWKRKAKTGELLVRQERLLPLPKRRKIRAIVPVALCFAILFCLFPPGHYAQQMRRLQGMFRSKEAVRLELTVGAREKNNQAVLDVVASEPQVLYLRGQVFEGYDGKSWLAAQRNDWSVWEPKGEVRAAARAPREMTFGVLDVTQPPSKQCLQLPQSTKTWAAPMTEGMSAAQIGAFVRKMAEYDENAVAMPENGDFVRWFVESGRGYCVHFASTAVVLLRAAGIPARLATGYVVQVQAGLRKTVTNSDAHAWAEYWDGQRWRILEATPTIEAVAVPPVQKENRHFGGWWVLILLPLALCFKKRKEASRVKELQQKAAFSRNGLTVEEKMELERLRQRPLHSLFLLRKAKAERKGKKMKQDEKKPIPWEVADPRPPVIQSGKMENRKQN